MNYICTTLILTSKQKKKDRMARRKRGEEVFSDEDD